MNFTTPTTKEEMYETLAEIFHYYRITRNGYEPCELHELELERLTHNAMTDNQIRSRAEIEVSASQEREKLKRTQELSSKISALNVKKQAVIDNASDEAEEIENKYDDSISKVRVEASKAGMGNSSLIIDKIALLESQKNDKVLEITSKKNSTVAEIEGEITALMTELSGVEDYFEDVFEAEISAKICEIKDAQKKEEREVIKYNNYQSEKEQKSANNTAEVNSTLQLRFMEIQSNYFTKDQLVEMGYYEDVLKCVTGYFDTLTPLQAFQQISHEHKLAIYLEDYYENTVYMYQARAVS